MAKLIVAAINDLSRFNEIADAIAARKKVDKELLLALASTFGNVRELVAMARSVDEHGVLNEIISVAVEKIAGDFAFICRKSGLALEDIHLLMDALVAEHESMIRAQGGEL